MPRKYCPGCNCNRKKQQCNVCTDNGFTCQGTCACCEAYRNSPEGRDAAENDRVHGVRSSAAVPGSANIDINKPSTSGTQPGPSGTSNGRRYSANRPNVFVKPSSTIRILRSTISSRDPLRTRQVVDLSIRNECMHFPRVNIPPTERSAAEKIQQARNQSELSTSADEDVPDAPGPRPEEGSLLQSMYEEEIVWRYGRRPRAPLSILQRENILQRMSLRLIIRHLQMTQRCATNGERQPTNMETLGVLQSPRPARELSPSIAEGPSTSAEGDINHDWYWLPHWILQGPREAKLCSQCECINDYQCRRCSVKYCIGNCLCCVFPGETPEERVWRLQQPPDLDGITTARFMRGRPLGGISNESSVVRPSSILRNRGSISTNPDVTNERPRPDYAEILRSRYEEGIRFMIARGQYLSILQRVSWLFEYSYRLVIGHLEKTLRSFSPSERQQMNMETVGVLQSPRPAREPSPSIAEGPSTSAEGDINHDSRWLSRAILFGPANLCLICECINHYKCRRCKLMEHVKELLPCKGTCFCCNVHDSDDSASEDVPSASTSGSCPSDDSDSTEQQEQPNSDRVWKEMRKLRSRVENALLELKSTRTFGPSSSDDSGPSRVLETSEQPGAAGVREAPDAPGPSGLPAATDQPLYGKQSSGKILQMSAQRDARSSSSAAERAIPAGSRFAQERRLYPRFLEEVINEQSRTRMPVSEQRRGAIYEELCRSFGYVQTPPPSVDPSERQPTNMETNGIFQSSHSCLPVPGSRPGGAEMEVDTHSKSRRKRVKETVEYPAKKRRLSEPSSSGHGTSSRRDRNVPGSSDSSDDEAKKLYSTFKEGVGNESEPPSGGGGASSRGEENVPDSSDSSDDEAKRLYSTFKEGVGNESEPPSGGGGASSRGEENVPDSSG